MSQPRPDQPGPGGPVEAALRCPRCDHGDIAVDYLGAVSVSLRDGRPVRVVAAGVLEGAPETLYCRRCGDDTPFGPAAEGGPRDPFLAALDVALGQMLPASVLDRLSAGVTIWEALPRLPKLEDPR